MSDFKNPRELRLSEQGLQFILNKEGFSPTEYVCKAGKRTIGFGHVVLPGENFSAVISRDEALELAKKDILKFELAVLIYFKMNMTQHMYDALVSFGFNAGAEALRTCSMRKFMMLRQYELASRRFLEWNKITLQSGKKSISRGLLRRRFEEANIFRKGQYPALSSQWVKEKYGVKIY